MMKFSFKSQYLWNATFLKAPNWSQQEVLKRCSAGSWCVCLVVTLSPIPLFLILSFEAPCLASANISGQEFPIFIIAFKAQYFQVVLYCNFLIKMKKSHSTYERMFETLPCLPFEFQKFHCLVLTKNNKWNHKAIAGFLWHSMPHFAHRYYFNTLSISLYLVIQSSSAATTEQRIWAKPLRSAQLTLTPLAGWLPGPNSNL